jgi:hypothetical protein
MLKAPGYCDFGNLSNGQRREYPTGPVIPRFANPVAVICALFAFAVARKLLQQTARLTIPPFCKARHDKNITEISGDKKV